MSDFFLNDQKNICIKDNVKQVNVIITLVRVQCLEISQTQGFGN
jgi:hypothetical protein